MPLGWVVYESGGQLAYVYFPTTSIVALLYGIKALARLKPENDDQKVGIDIVRRALQTPARQIIEGLGLAVASPEEARAILQLKGGDPVAF